MAAKTATMATYSYTTAITPNPTPPNPSNLHNFTPNNHFTLTQIPNFKNPILRTNKPPSIFPCFASSNFSPATAETDDEEDDYSDGEDERGNGSTPFSGILPPVRRKRRRYRKQYPGESEGITEEMRFVTMRLRGNGKQSKSNNKGESGEATEEGEVSDSGNGESWQPTMEGFLKYLVDSKLVFSTIERVVDEFEDVSYAYFRKTGLERADSISKDLEWFSQQGHVIPEPSNPGVEYSKYLENLAETSPPLFLCHFYNIYFSHIAGGQVITKKVCDKLLEGRVLEFNTWEGNAEELLKGVRDKLNMLGEHWSRKEKNNCLRDITKAFRYMGQIVRLIVAL